MGEFLSYSVVSGIMLLALYLSYRIFVARENQHSYNRGVLLAIYFISFLTLPCISLIRRFIKYSSVSPLSINDFEPLNITTSPLSRPIWGTVLIWIFLAGMITVGVKTIITWIRLINVIRSGKKIKRDDYILVITDNEKYAPFSWMNHVVISRTDFDTEYSAIITHELKHIASHHGIDLLIAQIACIINWFNPAVWLMRDELMLVHEYQADTAVIDSGYDPQRYQLILIKKAVGSRFPSLANSLNHSKLKKRITMMYKEKSNAGRKLKALALVPALALAFGVSTLPSVRAAVATISYSELYASKDSENPANNKKTQAFTISQISNYDNTTTVVVEGRNLGNTLTVTGGTLNTNGNTCQANSMECQMTNGDAFITVNFPYSGEYKDTSMTLTINGQIVTLDLNHFLTAGKSYSSDPVDEIAPSSSLEGFTIYIDGKEVTASDLETLPSEKVESVDVDKKEKIISVTLK